MIIIALGANLPSSYGSPEDTLEAAKRALTERGIEVVKSSSTIVTPPVPMSDQPWYHNAVVSVETTLEPLALLQTLHGIEKDFGRVRGVKNAPRLLDLDLIAYGNTVIDEGGVFVPHPRMHERGFVLFPLHDVAPDWVHPTLGRSVGELIAVLPDDQRPVEKALS